MWLALSLSCALSGDSKDSTDKASSTTHDSAADSTPTDEPGTDDTSTEETSSPTTEPCPPVDDQTRAAVVTDIDETLTTSDSEWLTQIALPFHDPEMRPDADLVMQEYLARGYRIFYLTARGEGLFLLDGTSAREATEDWLEVHGFPYTSDGVFLANGIGALGGEAADYKTAVLEDLQAQGFDILYAYGNADTDIEAYYNVGLDPSTTYLVGALAGQLGVVGIPTDEAYAAHLPSLADVPCGY